MADDLFEHPRLAAVYDVLDPDRTDLGVYAAIVAQAIVDDHDWTTTLTAVRHCLRPGGDLVFETRRPQRRAWQEWTREQTETVTTAPGHGSIRHWVQLRHVDLPLVTFESVRVFPDQTLTSLSTLRFRSEDEITTTLTECRFDVREVREAPDRPGRELVFLARRSERD